MNIIITSPSLDTQQNVSGISSVTNFIIKNNPTIHYIHFELGKKDNEKGGIYRLLRILKSIILWWITLNKHKDAIIHYNFPLSKASILRDPIFILIARLKKKKLIIHIHGGIFLTKESMPLYIKIILTRIFSLNCPFIVLSQKEKELIKKRFNCSNINILPNCIDLHEAQNYKKKIDLKNPLIIGYLGRIAESKGIGILLQSCELLKKKNIPIILKFAGKEEIEGQYLNNFKEVLGKDFIYEGIVAGEKKNQFIKSLDIFILPSFFEGLPISLLECMSFGVVPITTNVGSISEIIENNINGIFIEVKDSNSICEKIIYLNNNRELIQSLSIATQKSIFKNFSPSNYIYQLNNIYKSLINN